MLAAKSVGDFEMAEFVTSNSDKYLYHVPYDATNEGDKRSAYWALRDLRGTDFREYENTYDMLITADVFIDINAIYGKKAEKRRKAEQARIRNTPYDPFDL